MATQPKFVSFFSGAGGLDLGLDRAGWRCLAANEIDDVAVETLRKNSSTPRIYADDIRSLTTEVLCRDLRLQPGELFAVVGGPPCQAFSTAGRRKGLNDDRGNVFLHFLDLIAGLRPKYAIFENVRGLLSAPLIHRPHSLRGKSAPELSLDERPGGALRLILSRLADEGYSTTFNLYNTANFGVPQKRERLIFIASREGHDVPHLCPTHAERPTDGLLPWVTFDQAVYALRKKHHHFSQFPSSRIRFYELLKAGQNWRDLPSTLQAEAMGKSILSGGGKTGFFRRLAGDEPAPTLVTRPTMKATDLCHPRELRPLSVEEYAAVQTFPPDYHFCGSIDDQYRQIGNAVPCKFGEAVGRHVIAFDSGELEAATETTPLSRYRKTDERSWVGAHAQVGLFDRQDRECA